MNNAQESKAMPSDIPAEKSVLGSILAEQSIFEEVELLISPDTWYMDAHRYIWDAMANTIAEGYNLTTITLCDALKRSGKLEASGGEVYISELMDPDLITFEATTAKAHINILNEKSERRKRIIDTFVAHQDLFDESKAVGSTLSALESKIYDSGIQDHASTGCELLGASMGLIYDDIEKIMQGKEPEGIKSYIKTIDDKVGRFEPTDVVVIAARPSQGKTSLLLKLILENALRGIPSLMFSMETSRKKILRRIAAIKAKINLFRLGNGPLDQNDLIDLNEHSEILEKLPIYVDDTPNPSIAYMKRVALKHVKKYGVKFLSFDFLQKFHAKEKTSNRTLEIGMYMKFMKEIAKELNMPVFPLSQLSRANEKDGKEVRPPRLSDLRESGDIEQDADHVLFIHRDAYYNWTPENANDATIIIAKNKEGPTGDIHISFFGEYALFCD